MHRPLTSLRRLTAVIALSAFMALVLGGGANGQGTTRPSCAASPLGGNLCLLNTSGTVFESTGGSAVYTIERDLVINGDAKASGTPKIFVGEVGIRGAFTPSNFNFRSLEDAPKTATQLSAPQADPFANAPFLGKCSDPATPLSQTGGTVKPGVYSTVNLSGNVKLEPGIYTITGSWKSNGIVDGTDGVTLYFCGNAGITMSGGQLNLKAPGGPTDFALFFNRTNTGDVIDTSGGSTAINITGAVYAASGHLDFHPVILNVVGDVVAGSMKITSNSSLNIKQAPAGKLTVLKTITGEAAGERGPITIAVKCDDRQLPDFVIPVNDNVRGTFDRQYSDIPVGATCTVTETAKGATSTVKVTPSGFQAQSVNIRADQVETVSFDDDYEFIPGSLLVNKMITGPAAGLQGQIVIGVECDKSPPLPDFVIDAGATGTVPKLYPNIPADSKCSITESSNGHTAAGITVAISAGEVVVPAGGTEPLPVTNTVSSQPGTLVVNKTITGPKAGDQGAITIHVECNGTQLEPFTIPAHASAGVTSHTYSGLSPGNCTLTESPDGHTSTVHVKVTGDHQVTIPAEGGATASLVDTYTGHSGKLRVEKTITGPGAGRQGTVRIRASCDGSKHLPDFVIPAGVPAGSRSHTYENLPAGIPCTVVETVNGHTHTIVVTVTGDGRRVTIPANGTVTAAIRDHYTRIPGSLTVRKTITGPRAARAGSIRIGVTCGNRRRPTFVIGAGRGAGTFSRRYNNLAAGTTCIVAEVENGRTATTAVTVRASRRRVTIPANGIAVVALTDTYRRSRVSPIRRRLPRFTG